MMNDPIVEELHAQREAHASQFNFDVAKIIAHYRQLQSVPSRADAVVVDLTQTHSVAPRADSASH